MNARARSICGERDEPEMTGLRLRRNVIPARTPPARKVFRRDEYTAVAPRSAACAAREAVEL